MKYYSEITRKLYDSLAELKAAEKKALKLREEEAHKKAEQETRLKEVEVAFEEFNQVEQEARDMVSAALRKYQKLYKEYLEDFVVGKANAELKALIRFVAGLK